MGPKKVKKNQQVENNEEEVQPNWKNQLDTLLLVEKPDDNLDCKVDIPENMMCDVTRIKTGSLLYRPARIIVLNKDYNQADAKVRNQDLHSKGVDSDWDINRNLLGKQCWSADQYKQIEKITQTQLAHKLKEEVGDCLCKVEFYKNPDSNEMAQLIKSGSQLIEQSGLSNGEKIKLYKKLYERSQKGEYRIMRGYIVRGSDMHLEQNDTGMIKFLDADILAKGEMAERLINIRTINALTFKLTKYVLK